MSQCSCSSRQPLCSFPQTEQSGGRLEKIVFELQNIHCLDCSSFIESYLLHFPGVIEAKANFVLNSIAIKYDPLRITPEGLKRALRQPGFELPQNIFIKGFTYYDHYQEIIHTILTGLFLLCSFMFSKIVPPSLFAGLFSILAVFIGGFPIFLNAFLALRIFKLNANSLVSLASVSALLHGDFFEAGLVIFIMLLGESLEEFTLTKTKKAISSIVKGMPQWAIIKVNGEEKKVAVNSLKKDDVVIIRPGIYLPADGTIVSGEGCLNEAALTGESLPITKTIGDQVYGGTISENGAFEVRLDKVGEDTILAKVKNLILQAENSRVPSERVADHFAQYFVPVVLILAAGIFLITNDISRALTVLIVACPCALIIGIPTAIIAGIGKAAQNGILIRGGEFLEKISSCNAIYFDKTGTLTHGKLAIHQIVVNDGYEEKDVVAYAALAEKRSEHKIAEALRCYAEKKHLSIPDPEKFQTYGGKGVKVVYQGQEIVSGNDQLLKELDIQLINFNNDQKIYGTKINVAIDQKHVGSLYLTDQPKDEVSTVFKQLKGLGIQEIGVITGDRVEAARFLEKTLPANYIHSDLLPGQKHALIKHCQEQGKKVIMVGDGINDGSSLAQADVGISMGQMGTDLAIECSDIIISSDRLTKIPQVIQLSRRVVSIIKQNIVLATIFNLVMILLSMLGLVSMIMGAVFHQISSLFVIFNSMRILFSRR
ncbi:MAG: Cd2+/Zn2+-exporting ATPase [Candidatus Saganbacteria bacterium]|uniref:Cd2+/Zn2+-exporting ATPase n=1 Tax=Candidatus Saganbacteria bacterium TaxID=2575572 RepID=A0A833L1P3_UNCSA|nr:MAG: Cd2+/Zn2+-exporting ATPase [Candidatus Saganbacteria bacterium]